MHQQPTTVVHKRGANHGLHLFLTIITMGLWAVTGWPIAAMMGRKTKTTTYAPPPAAPYPPQYAQQPYPPQGQAPYPPR